MSDALEPLLYLQSHGDEHRKSSQHSPSIVLLHGLFGSGDNLAVIRRHFEADYHVVSIDLPDHGKSPRTQHFSFDDWAQLLITTMTHHDITQCFFIAHSLGGKIAMRAASLAPEMFIKVIIMDIAPVAYEPRHHNVINGLSAVKLAQLNSRQEALAQLSEHVVDSGTRSFLMKSLYQDNDQQWQWRFNLELLVRDYPILSDWPFSGKLFDGDITFIKGKKSDYITSEHQAAIIAQFPNAKARIVDAGHWLHAEKPQLVNTSLTRILLGRQK
ncbi:alpha/beta fold hydrolase [Glaciecola sp. MH2013]|uniref:alpha/beta fold hydrolase n=1 Tax=Glaciecola sp. MH2013 TaxID=2785524 RepID=UPI00189FC038|nr:alpha/beta fold hydrolase [Glaciecola sp. MH2013]MBF7072748.1 alpha/beta fold hydrolase [Glaciecola sp. MH2013]